MLEAQIFTLPGLPNATNPPGRLAQFMRMVDAFERDEIETAVDMLIARLDLADGDPELEDDDTDTCQAGDDGCAPFMTFHGVRWGTATHGEATA